MPYFFMNKLDNNNNPAAAFVGKCIDYNKAIVHIGGFLGFLTV